MNPVGQVLKAPVPPPEWLKSEAAREQFRTLQEPLIAAGILQTLDIHTLALAAQHWGDYIEARRLVLSESPNVAAYIETHGKDVLIEYMTSRLSLYMPLLAKFAGSPADRVKIGTPKPKPKSKLENALQ